MDIAINQSFEASGSIGQFIVPNRRTDQIIAIGQTDEFKTSVLAEDCGLKIPAAPGTKDDTRTVCDALSITEDDLSLKTMSRVDLDVPDVHDFLISRGGTLGGRSRASLGDRFYFCIHVPSPRRRYVGNREGTILLCTDSDFAIWTSHYVQITVKAARFPAVQRDVR